MGSKLITLGITGQAGVGKSYAANILKEKCGFRIIDLDIIGHQCLLDKDVIDSLVKEFGESILINDTIDRSILSSIVFSDKNSLNALNLIVHPCLVEKVMVELENFKMLSNTVIVGALISELNLIGVCDFLIVINTSKDSHLSNYELTKVRKIRDNQMTNAEYNLLSPFILNNNMNAQFELDLIEMINNFA